MPRQRAVDLLAQAMQTLVAGFAHLPPSQIPSTEAERENAVLAELAVRLHDNFPYFHPLYAGQMLKPPHPVAHAAYSLAMSLNPNNHALDGGRATSAMEKESVAHIAAMFGWTDFLGHLCGGGTVANLEALWIAGQIHPGKTILASEQAHYTHKRMSVLLKLPFETLPCDAQGRMKLNALRDRLSRGDVGAVIATIGTTATGSIDPLPEILELRVRYNFRLHADAAYGGYFLLADNLDAHARRCFDLIAQADSIVIDPHKHGLQPYGCGCVLFRDPAVGRFYKHDSPYTYFSSQELHLGEISLECSRPGAAAAALWATQKLLPLVKHGEFARGLQRSREAALTLHAKLLADDRFISASAPELDIVVFLPRAASVSAASTLSHRVFAAAAKHHLHLALAELPTEFFHAKLGATTIDSPTVTCLRSVLMKPEHLDWIDRIWNLLIASLGDA